VDEATLETLETLEGSASDQPDVDALSFARSRLSVPHRQVVLMRFVDDLQLDEIAALLGVPVGTVKSRLHHALSSLREDPRTRALLEP
jgi:RNA polymerase sigma-70 factor (ECF subfamily)